MSQPTTFDPKECCSCAEVTNMSAWNRSGLKLDAGWHQELSLACCGSGGPAVGGSGMAQTYEIQGCSVEGTCVVGKAMWCHVMPVCWVHFEVGPLRKSSTSTCAFSCELRYSSRLRVRWCPSAVVCQAGTFAVDVFGIQWQSSTRIDLESTHKLPLNKYWGLSSVRGKQQITGKSLIYMIM